MLNRSSRGLFVVGLVLLATTGLTGCAEIQKAAEGAARSSGNERWRRRSICGTSSAGCYPSDTKKNKPSDKRRLAVVARYGGVTISRT